jgi:DNA-binding NarL/FixJ family response regulator
MDNGAAVMVRDLRKSYRDVAAVRGIDLEINRGEVFALLGPNGAGKTTTVEILEGFRRRDIEVAGEAASGPEAVARARTGGFDVILMDLRMPGGDGVAATEHILAADPGARVLILTTYETDADILRAVEAGATGYLLKDATPAELAGAVRAAARGETVLAPSVAERLISHVRRPPRESLSARETEVLAQVARGRTNAEIGQALFISEATVKTHLLRAFGKLGVSGRTAAVTTAIERGLLPPPGGNR